MRPDPTDHPFHLQHGMAKYQIQHGYVQNPGSQSIHENHLKSQRSHTDHDKTRILGEQPGKSTAYFYFPRTDLVDLPVSQLPWTSYNLIGTVSR